MRRTRSERTPILEDNRHNIIGSRIRQLRYERNLSQQQLADEMKKYGAPLDQKQLSAVEIGRRNISDYEVFAFSKCLNVSLDSLYEPAEPAKRRRVKLIDAPQTSEEL